MISSVGCYGPTLNVAAGQLLKPYMAVGFEVFHLNPLQEFGPTTYRNKQRESMQAWLAVEENPLRPLPVLCFIPCSSFISRMTK